MQKTVHKQWCEIQFAEIQEDLENRKCVVCPNVAREWASVSNGVFMCVSCAAECKDLSQSLCLVKSINQNHWSERQINLMKRGGNTKFLAFMEKFKLTSLNFQDKLCTSAAVYYRQKLAAEVDGFEPPIEPFYDQGRVIVITNKSDPEQPQGEQAFLDTAKGTISNAYDITKKFTTETFRTIGEKITSEEFKKDLSEFGTKTKDVAVAGYEKTKEGLSYLLGAISSKVSGNKQ